MPLVLSGTNGVSGVDGSASNPSYEGTDSNTGIFFPAADTIAFAEGGTEVARFDSSGNFGIGTPSPATALTLGNNRVLSWPNAAGNYNGTTTGTQILKFSDNNLYIDNLDASTNILFRRNGPTESMRIDSSGNLLVGWTSQVWGERLSAQNRASNSAEVMGVYASSSAYTGSLMKMQTETAGSNSWYHIEFLSAGGNRQAVINGNGSYSLQSASVFGYGTGSGGTVTQATNKSTAVTLNKPTGQITMNGAALGANTAVIFQLNNSVITSSDTIIINVRDGSVTFTSNYIVTASPGSGLANISVVNRSGGSLSEAVVLNFSVIKGATS